MKRTIPVLLAGLAVSLSAQAQVNLWPNSQGREFGGPLRHAIETELAEAGGRFAFSDRAGRDYTMFVRVRLHYDDASPVELMTFDGESVARVAETMRIGRGFGSLGVLVNLRHRTCRSAPDERIEFKVWRSKFDEVAMARIATGIRKQLDRRRKLLQGNRLWCE